MTEREARRTPGRDSSEARWRIVKDILRREIMEGHFPPGSRLPPERGLAERFRVNRLTLRRAISELEGEGLVAVRHGVGTFVNADYIAYTIGSRVRFGRTLEAQGVTPRRDILGSATERADPNTARRLSIDDGAFLVRVELLSFADDRPIATSCLAFPADRFLGIDRAIREHGSISRALVEFGVADFRRSLTEIVSRMPSDREASLLRQPASRPVLGITSIDVDDAGRKISLRQGCACGDRVMLVLDDEETFSQ